MGVFRVTETRTENDDILEGALHCEKCKREFPIRDGVANLVPIEAPPEKVVSIRFIEDPDERRQ
jgi:uncharacterized protein YbaR (Trm112 family)